MIERRRPALPPGDSGGERNEREAEAGPQIDLDPHEYQRAGEQRASRLVLAASVALLLLAFWQTDLLTNWKAWVLAFFAVLFGMALVGAFPRYWFNRDK